MVVGYFYLDSRLHFDEYSCDTEHVDCDWSTGDAASRQSRDSTERAESEEEMYSSGEEMASMWTVENRQVFEEFKNVEIDVSLRRKGILTTELEQQGKMTPRSQISLIY